MIKVGDIVRFSNEYLKRFKRFRYKNAKFFRAKQQLAKVVAIEEMPARWMHGKKTFYLPVLTLDIPDPFLSDLFKKDKKKIFLKILLIFLCYHQIKNGTC